MKKLLLLHILFLSFPLCAQAHVPVLPKKDSTAEQPQKLIRPYNKSIAIYTFFESSDDLDVFEFNLNEEDLKNGPVQILIGTLVPACKPLKELLISSVLVGPAQEALQDEVDLDTQELIGFQPDQGALALINTEQGKVWEEPYTRHYYFRQQRKIISLTKPGIYKIYSWPSNELGGDYVFEFGDKEIWRLKDILYTLWVYPKLLLEKEIKTKDCRTTKNP